jgi:hypothetical protein
MFNGRANWVDPGDPVVRMAAYLAVNEPGNEEPRLNVTVKGQEHYRVDSAYFAKAEARLTA